ncbi:MAG: HAMP domain-containing sensor histidine kinase [Microscillaceae bacterium]|nr:HAMP domain-containing sensor histidine kinase [Microscillaceae bacterium]
MKLLTKTTIYHLLLSMAFFCIGGMISYQLIFMWIDQDVNEYFDFKESKIRERILQGEEVMSERYRAIPLDKPLLIPDKIIDTTMFNGTWHAPYKKKTMVRVVNGQLYHITIFKYFDEQNDEIEAVIGTVYYLAVGFLIIFVVFNYFLSRRIWLPFNHTLQEIKNFKIRENRPLVLQPTNIYEFQELNRLVLDMTGQIQRDYNNLKEFTENASHEIQTPLAIIKVKLEMLLSTGELSTEQSKLVQSAYTSTSRLSQLGKALALITRIENHEFEDHVKEVNLNQILESHLDNFEEIIRLKGITLETDLDLDVSVQMAPLLADILFSNLIKNAVKHNLNQGIISLHLSPYSFTICNTGKPPKGSTDLFFERFRKDNQASNSLGLGLAIVKKICDVSGFEIHYAYENDLHTITIRF